MKILVTLLYFVAAGAWAQDSDDIREKPPLKQVRKEVNEAEGRVQAESAKIRHKIEGSLHSHAHKKSKKKPSQDETASKSAEP